MFGNLLQLAPLPLRMGRQGRLPVHMGMYFERVKPARKPEHGTEGAGGTSRPPPGGGGLGGGGSSHKPFLYIYIFVHFLKILSINNIIRIIII